MAKISGVSGPPPPPDSPAAPTGTPPASDVKAAVTNAEAGAQMPLKAVPQEPFEERLAKVRAATNPLLEASRVLLRAQADMDRVDLQSKRSIATLKGMLVQEVETFQKLCEQANIRRDHMIGARYCLCTALDEEIMNTPWGRGSENGFEWGGSGGLATTFHEDRDGGTKVTI